MTPRLGAVACCVTGAEWTELQSAFSAKRFWCMKGIGDAPRVVATTTQHPKESTVAKGLEQKKETKKKPAKTMKEKKADKNAKKASK